MEPRDTKRASRWQYTKLSRNNNVYLHKINFRGNYFDMDGRLISPRPSYQKGSDRLPALSHVLNLIKDYYAPKGGLFLTGHWNRHHITEAKKLYENIHNAATQQQALDYLVAQRKQLMATGETNINGSLMRRLSYSIDTLVDSLPTHRRTR